MVSCFAAQPVLMNKIIANYCENDSSSKTAFFSKNLVSMGLISPEYRMRDSYYYSIKTIVDLVESEELTKDPLRFFLGVLMD